MDDSAPVTLKPIDSFENQPNFIELKGIYATQAKRIVFFAGAGLSALNGLPTWQKLREMLQNRHEADIGAMPRGVDHEKLHTRLERVRKVPDPWDAFELIKTLLGNALFAEEVTRALSISHSNNTHELIRRLWRLKIEGIVTLNLDNLLETAFRLEKSAQVPTATGQNFTGSSHVLQSREQWLFHMHGKLDQRDTWIFTRSELTKLLSKSELKFALQSLFFQCCVVFVGVGANDAAIQEHLDNLLRQSVSINTCFWITNRANKQVFEWCRKYNIRPIFYSEDEFSHEEALAAVLDGIEGAETYYEPAPPISASVAPRDIDFSPLQLLQMEAEQARALLNSYARKILQERDETERNTKYEQFRHQYLPAINHAGLVSNKPPYDRLFGYTLHGEPLGGGAFAQVHRAKSPAGADVAIKMTHRNVVQDDSMLNSFRQGVSSLKILRDAAVPGVVRLEDAYEIPPVLVMEYIGGRNLQQVATSHRFDPIAQGVPILAQAFHIVRDAHRLPQTVFHRDIRPPNIMIRGFSDSDLKPENVVVLDFDLSWHQGGVDLVAHEKMSLAVGYLAPEQLTDGVGLARKSALVDVYGMGMTLYFCLAGNQPTIGEQDLERWTRALDEVSRRGSAQWHCVGHRISRLIAAATLRDANKRLSASAMEAELETLSLCLTSGTSTVPAIWVEEVCAKVFGRGEYTWTESDFTGVNKGMLGFETTISAAVTSNGQLELFCHMRRSDIGQWNRRTIGPQLQSLATQAERLCEDRRLTLESARVLQASIEVRVSIISEMNLHAISRWAEAFSSVKTALGRELH